MKLPYSRNFRIWYMSLLCLQQSYSHPGVDRIRSFQEARYVPYVPQIPSSGCNLNAHQGREQDPKSLALPLLRADINPASPNEYHSSRIPRDFGM